MAVSVKNLFGVFGEFGVGLQASGRILVRPNFSQFSSCDHLSFCLREEITIGLS